MNTGPFTLQFEPPPGTSSAQDIEDGLGEGWVTDAITGPAIAFSWVNWNVARFLQKSREALFTTTTNVPLPARVGSGGRPAFN